MAYNNFQQKDMTGTLFLNDKKIAEKQPDYRGTSVINGKIVNVSAWVKVAKSGKKYLSLSYQFATEHPDITKFNKKAKPVEIEDNRITFDEDFGEPQSELNQKIDEFDKQLNTNTEDTQEIPF